MTFFPRVGPNWAQYNICAMPNFPKNKPWKAPYRWEDIKHMEFLIINGQHTIATARKIIKHNDTTK